MVHCSGVNGGGAVAISVFAMPPRYDEALSAIHQPQD
jgi:hypothetical protein